jgi:hypothetical protein
LVEAVLTEGPAADPEVEVDPDLFLDDGLEVRRPVDRELPAMPILAI